MKAKTKSIIRTITAPNEWRCAFCDKVIWPGERCAKKGKQIACYDHIYWLGEKIGDK